MKGEQGGGKERMIRGRDKNAKEETTKKEVCVQGNKEEVMTAEERRSLTKPSTRRRWRRRGRLETRQDGERGGGWRVGRFYFQRVQQNPVSRSGLCLSTATIRLEALLCSFCCGMLSTYSTGATSSHHSFMQITVRPGSGLSVLPQIQSVSADLRPCERPFSRRTARNMIAQCFREVTL